MLTRTQSRSRQDFLNFRSLLTLLAFFQKAKEAKIEYQLEKIETVATLLEDTEKEFKNESVDEEKPEEFSFQKEYPKEEGFQFDGFTYAGDYLGGNYSSLFLDYLLLQVGDGRHLQLQISRSFPIYFLSHFIYTPFL